MGTAPAALLQSFSWQPGTVMAQGLRIMDLVFGAYSLPHLLLMGKCKDGFRTSVLGIEIHVTLQKSGLQGKANSQTKHP